MNNLDFYDDDSIRKIVTERLEKEKLDFEKIKLELEQLINWCNVEEQILLEKEKILKSSKEEFYRKLKDKKSNLDKIYGQKNINQVKIKYNIRL
jgi:hypothetical protein